MVLQIPVVYDLLSLSLDDGTNGVRHITSWRSYYCHLFHKD